MLGKLTLAAIPYQNPIVMGAVAFMVIAAVAVLGTITVLGKWKYLWTEWLTSVDHKKIGAMYIILAGVMLLRGFADAVMMRAQQALAYGPHPGYLPPTIRSRWSICSRPEGMIGAATAGPQPTRSCDAGAARPPAVACDQEHRRTCPGVPRRCC